MDLSVVVIARNEEQNIGRCLAALEWCDDVLVVDDFSDDHTRDVAESHGARVLQNKFRSFASQRNWALDAGGLRHGWVLMLDADEVMTEPLRRELETDLASVSAGTAGFLMCRKTIFLDRWLRFSDGFPVWIMRLVRRDGPRFADAGHGEEPVPAVDGTLQKIREPFLHYPFSKGLADWVNRHNRYSTLEADLEFHRASRVVFGDLFSFDRAARRKALRNVGRRLPFRPFWRFCFHYFAKAGFLDGRAGWQYAWLMSVYEGLIVLKVRERRLRRDTAPSRPVSAASVSAPSPTASSLNDDGR
ncbi:MAG: glycosyltransferase family 2 protein [Planctomycetia bacterium]|nr:glycosyltransferase family 2 protein [Planctomycetia bacterium]